MLWQFAPLTEFAVELAGVTGGAPRICLLATGMGDDSRIVAAFYDAALRGLAPDVAVPPRRSHVRQVFHTYVIQAEARTKLIAHLDAHGVETKIHYPIPIHLQKAAEHLGYKRGAFPVCEAQSERILSLPIHEHLSSDEQAYVVERIREFYRG